MRSTFSRGAMAALCLLPPTPMLAEMSQFWEDLRAASNALSTAACNGEDGAFDELYFQAVTRLDPTAMTSFGWLLSSDGCQSYSGDEAVATRLFGDAAKIGYPLAASNYGIRLVAGFGVEKDILKGTEWIEKAVDGGYPEGAVHFGKAVMQGDYGLPVSYEVAYGWLRHGEDRGADERLVAQAWDDFERNTDNVSWYCDRRFEEMRDIEVEACGVAVGEGGGQTSQCLRDVIYPASFEWFAGLSERDEIQCTVWFITQR